MPEMVLVESGSFFMGENMFGRPVGDIDTITQTTDQLEVATAADAFTGATRLKESPAHRVYMFE